MTPPSVWEGYACKCCGAYKVIARGYCARCYRQVNRGKEPLARKQADLVSPTRVVLMLPNGLVRKIRKIVGNRFIGAWIAEACQRRLDAGPDTAPELTSDVRTLRGRASGDDR